VRIGGRRGLSVSTAAALTNYVAEKAFGISVLHFISFHFLFGGLFLSFPFNVHHAESVLLQGGVFCGREQALPAQALDSKSNPMPMPMPLPILKPETGAEIWFSIFLVCALSSSLYGF